MVSVSVPTIRMMDASAVSLAQPVLNGRRKKLGVDFSTSYAVGDRIADLLPGAHLGCRTILVLTGHGREELENRDGWEMEPDCIALDLLSAVQWMLSDTET